MARITVQQAQSWAESTKLPVNALDVPMLTMIENQVLGTLSAGFDTSTWLDTSTTPPIVQQILAMLYVSWFYNRQYSEDQEHVNVYSTLLRAEAESLIQGLLTGSVLMPGQPNSTETAPSFYPTDSSSALTPTTDDTSLGDAKFSMGRIF
jgi:hypothetical protein